MALNSELWQVQAGDKILLDLSPGWRVKEVARVTPTQIVVQYDKFEVRYWKKNGRKVGSDTYDGQYAYVFDAEAQVVFAEAQQRAVKRGLASRVSHIDWALLPAPLVQAVAELLVEAGVGGDELRAALVAARRYVEPKKEA
jgi:hypothetical protein